MLFRSRALDRNDSVVEALEDYGRSQTEVGRGLISRTERIGRRSQVENSWVAGDPEFVFGLRGPGQ